ncbi:MAG: phage protein GemA/Gp16 family protein [Paracoccaceae bacterium]
MNRSLQKLVFAACRQLGLDDEARRDLQVSVTGKASMRDMTEADLKLVVNRLKESGFDPDGGKRKRPRAPRADIRFCHVMWRLLHEAGAAKVKGPEGLNAFVRARFEKTWGYVPVDIDALREWSEIKDVVEALKDWCDREGIELET